jgi:ribonuclease HII|tara:strand:- start:11651 stop:12247 length:597 start_codon:yes stop_codon:yes gene_type:complete
MLKNSFSNKIEAGCDEAGRGCLAGPVVAASVILSKNFKHPLLNDSKQLSRKNRDLLEKVIKEKAVVWGIGVIWNQEIDKINILNTSIKAMHKSIEKLKIKPELLLIDGNRFHAFKDIPHKCIIKGDAKYACIAAASVLAKTYRDKLMQKLHLKFPQFDWKNNKGYPTKIHRQSIVNYGITKYHRKSFKLLPLQLKLNL